MLSSQQVLPFGMQGLPFLCHSYIVPQNLIGPSNLESKQKVTAQAYLGSWLWNIVFGHICVGISDRLPSDQISVPRDQATKIATCLILSGVAARGRVLVNLLS